MEQTIGMRIRRLRHRQGLSAVQLAQKVGLTENALRKLEAGDSKEPRFKTGLRLAQTLGVAPCEIAGLGAENFAGPELAATIRIIRNHADDLKKQNVRHLSVFGSVARGDAHAASDIDIVVQSGTPGAMSLLNLASAADILQRALQRKTDVITMNTLKASPFGRQALEEAVDVF